LTPVKKPDNLITDGKRLPLNELEFAERFATEESCQVYLEQLRWPNGFIWRISADSIIDDLTSLASIE